MTKLMQWMLFICIYGALYYLILGGSLPLTLTHEHRFLIMLSPVILIGLFGLYSIVVIAYRVATFNDCPEAAAELRKEIKEAKSCLSTKGLKFE